MKDAQLQRLSRIIYDLDIFVPDSPYPPDEGQLEDSCEYCHAPAMTNNHHDSCSWVHAKKAIDDLRKLKEELS